MSNFVPGCGPSTAKLVIVGEAPGAFEEKARQPFVGPAGQELDELLKEAGVHRSECYLTNVVKFRPPDNNFKRLPEIGVSLEESVALLYRELNAIREAGGAYCILALGAHTLFHLTGKSGINKWRGSILQTPDKKFKVVSTIHPANLLPGYTQVPYQNRAFMILDIARAKEESQSLEYNVPIRNLQIARSSLDVERFLGECTRRWKATGNPVTGDIESARGVPICIAFAYDRFNAMSIPFLNLVSDYNPTGFSVREQKDIIKATARFMSSGIPIIWQNGKFDEERLDNVWMIHNPNVHADTSLIAHTLNPEFPKSLGFNTSIYTREPYYKDEGKDIDFIKDRKKVFADFPAYKKRLHIYNARDAAVDYEWYEEQQKELKEYNLTSFYYGYANKMHRLYADMERRGFRVNEQRRLELLVKYLRWEEEINLELKSLLGWVPNHASTAQVRKALYEDMGYPIRKDRDGKVKADEETIVSLIANHTKKPEQARVARLISIKRRVAKTIGTYLLARPDYDGRMRTVYRLSVTEEGKNGGTETGRTSTSVLKPPVRPEKMGMAFQTITKHGDIGPDVRTMFEADEGYIILEADLSQAEARIAANLSNDEETLHRFDTEDIHRRTASWCFGKAYEEISKKSNERQIGKTTRYLRQYRGHKKRLMNTLMSDAFRFNIENFHITEAECGRVIKTFDAFTPKLASVFWRDVERCLLADRVLINPFGRRRQFFARYDENLLREATPYIPSSTTKDKLTEAMLFIEEKKPGTLFMLEAHDALVLQCKESELAEYRQLIKESLESPIDFSRCSLPRNPLRIPCEIKLGLNYGELEEIK